ncbi:MAG: MFS transporter [Gemmataceae bacterium]|nr:MFS transporter [Gemmataceae bacterium]
MASVSPPEPQRLTATHWLILIIASIGFAFDIYELLMLPLILPPALQELLPGVAPGSDTFIWWRGMMFWVPALAGGLFGLLGGYLTDYLGRRRVLTWSILLYAVSAFLAGFSTSMPMLLVLRTTTFVGVCVEFVAAVAWLAELFPNPAQREKALGYTQAFSSIGGLMVTGAWLLAGAFAASLPAIAMPEFLTGVFGTISEQGAHAPWRYTLMSGLIPALPLLIIRPFLPESPVWKQKKETGTLKRPSFAQLFAPQLRTTTLVTTLMVGLSYGAAFGAIQQIPQIVPALPEVKVKVRPLIEAKQADIDAKVAKVLAKEEPKILEKTAGDAASAQKERDELAKKIRTIEEKAIARPVEGATAGHLQLSQEVGGLVGRFVLALLVVHVLSRRALIRIFQVPGLFVVPVVFAIFTLENKVLFEVGAWQFSLLHIGIFLVGLLTVAQFSFWGNYLPLVYPVHLRGTGESMAHNVGGRMLGTSFAAVVSFLSVYFPGVDDPTRMAYAAAGVGLFVYLLGFLLSFFLPEPKEETLHE